MMHHLALAAPLISHRRRGAKKKKMQMHNETGLQKQPDYVLEQ